MDDYEFDAEAVCRMIADEMERQKAEWNRDMAREVWWLYQPPVVIRD